MAIQKTRRRSPFNLPSSWGPGMALPDNVIDEGLERRALVTQQRQDGTFDNPSVNSPEYSSGYAIPEYINREGYGRGAFVSKQAPRGTYYGPEIPDWLNYPVAAAENVQRLSRGRVGYTMESLAGDDGAGGGELPAVYADYGRKAAAVILKHVGQQPPARRKAELRRALDRIDRSLWGRTEAIAKRYEKQGASPAAALRDGLARAMGAGILAEVIKTGVNARPPVTGQLGLGCFSGRRRMSALGGGAPRAGRTRTARGGLGWAPGSQPLPSREWTPPAPVAPTGPMLQVGPWQVPADAESYTMVALPSALDDLTKLRGAGFDTTLWRNKIGIEIVRQWQLQVANGLISGRCVDRTYGAHYFPASDLGLIVPALYTLVPSGISQEDLSEHVVNNLEHASRGCSAADKDLLNRAHKDGGWVPAVLFTSPLVGRPVPLYRAKHPITGADYGLFLVGSPIEGGNFDADKTMRLDRNAAGNFLHIGGPLRIEWRKIPPAQRAWYEKIWDSIADLAASVVKAIGDVIDEVGDLACTLINSPLAAVGAQVGAATQGVPPATGAAGVELAQSISGCKKDGQPPGYMPPPPTTKSYLPVAIIGVAAVGAAFMLSKKKR